MTASTRDWPAGSVLVEFGRTRVLCAASVAEGVPRWRAGSQSVVRAEWRGTLAREPRGTNGFGYDPIFIPEGHIRTSAELEPAEKDALSHRGLALRKLVPRLRELLT